MSSVTVDHSGNVLTLETSSGTHRFHAIWLRDNAQDAATRAPGNGQRLITLRDIPADTRIAAAEFSADGAVRLRFDPEDKTVTFDPAWLEAHSYDHPAPQARGWLPAGTEPWDASLMQNVPCGDFRILQGGWTNGSNTVQSEIMHQFPVPHIYRTKKRCNNHDRQGNGF